MPFSIRHRAAIVALALACGVAAHGQEASSSGGSAGSGSSRGSGSAGSGSGAEGRPSGTGSALGSGSAAPSSAFGGGSGSSSSFSVFSSEPPSAPTESAPATEAEPTAGSGGSGSGAPASGSGGARGQEPSFTVPGFYGQGSTTFFGGSGRLARPRFRMGFTFGFGYDDNVFSAPSDDTPTIVPGPAQFVQTPVTTTQQRFGDGGLQESPGQMLTTTTQTGIEQEIVEGEPLIIPPAERKGSMFTRAGLTLEMQRYTPRTLFTLNASGSHSYYWDREDDPTDYSGTFAMTYLHRITPRLQAVGQANIAYISQPDLARPNTPQRETQGDLVNSQARADISYRFTPRLSLSVAANYNAYRYTEEIEQTGDFDEYTVGIEAKYLWKPRWTLTAEYRHAATSYLNRNDIDSTTEYLLVGTEFILSPRLSGALRIGESIRQFDVGGDAKSAPYVESSVSYRSTARSQVTWHNRFGFEESQSVTQERLVYRGSINYTYMFSPRLQGTAGVNLVHEVTTEELTDTDSAIDTFESTLGLEYNMTPHFTLNGYYTLTISNTSTGLSDYYRNRVFVGGQYTF